MSQLTSSPLSVSPLFSSTSIGWPVAAVSRPNGSCNGYQPNCRQAMAAVWADIPWRWAGDIAQSQLGRMARDTAEREREKKAQWMQMAVSRRDWQVWLMLANNGMAPCSIHGSARLAGPSFRRALAEQPYQPSYEHLARIRVHKAKGVDNQPVQLARMLAARSSARPSVSARCILHSAGPAGGERTSKPLAARRPRSVAVVISSI